MNDRRRYAIAWTCSLVLHVAAVPILSSALVTPRLGLGPLPEKSGDILIRFQHAEPESKMANRLVDTPVASNEPAQDTDLVSDKNSKAADTADTKEDSNAPHVDRIADFEQLAILPTTTSTPLPLEAEVKEHQDETSKDTQDKNDSPKKDAAAGEPPLEPLQVAMLEQSLRKPELSAQIEEYKPSAESAAPPAQPEAGEAQSSESRVEGGVANSGFLSFEAMRHELAPYLKDVQSRVEKRWRVMLDLKFKGNRAAKAVVDCSISPDGKLVSVEIVNTGDSLAYGPLCKQAIESAAPFPPFPFNVPDVYREKNLEIRWTFNFM